MSTETITGVTIPVADLQAIVASMRTANPEPTLNEIWNDAAITGVFSLSAGGGSLEGWLSLYDGRKYHFQSLEITDRSGTAAGTFAIPYARVRPLKDVEIGNFDLKGFWAGGILSLSCVKDGLQVLSAAPWDYHLAGTVKCTKA